MSVTTDIIQITDNLSFNEFTYECPILKETIFRKVCRLEMRFKFHCATSKFIKNTTKVFGTDSTCSLGVIKIWRLKSNDSPVPRQIKPEAEIITTYCKSRLHDLSR